MSEALRGDQGAGGDGPGGDDLGIAGVEGAVLAGRGGFATVYRAWQPAFRRTVAVKVLDRRLDPTALARFQREQQAMGALSHHPAIVTVLDGGLTSTGHPYLLMPFFDRGSLQDVLDREGPRPWEEVVAAGVRLAGALEAAHAEGVLHRDVKPANVLLSRYGDVLLADFGIARLVGGHETTTGGPVSASIAHAAPEILDGMRPSVAADVYSLGSTLYALLAGRPAFASPTDESILPLLSRILTQPLPPLPPTVPAALSTVLERAMAKQPADRHPTARALGEALQAVQHQAGLPVTPLPVDASGATPGRDPATGPPASPPRSPEPTAEVPASAQDHTVPVAGPAAPDGPPTPPPAPAPIAAPTPARPRRRGPALLVGVLVLGVVAVGGWVLLGGGGEEVPEGPDVADLEAVSLYEDVVIDEDVRLLVPGEPIEATIGHGTAHAYRGVAPAGYLHLRMTALDAGIDPVLAVFDQDGTELFHDDDTGGGEHGHDALLEGSAGSEGTVTVVAAGYDADSAGRYRLTLTVPTGELDGTRAGELTRPDEVVAWTFTGVADELITLHMRSTDVDSHLQVWSLDDEVLVADDDSGGGASGADARAELRLPADGTYVVVGSANGEVGAFEVELERG